MTAEKCLCGHRFAAGGDEFIWSEVVAVGKLHREGRFCCFANMSAGNDECLIAKRKSRTWKTYYC